MGHNKEISIKRPLDIGQDAKLPKAKVAKNNFSDTLKDVTAISINLNSKSESFMALQQSPAKEIDKEQSMVDHNMSYGKTLLNSERTITLKDNLKGELGIDKTIPQYNNYIKGWLNGCLAYEFVGERIGKQISKNDQMLHNPAPSIISSVEAVMNLIENNVQLGCLDTTTLDELSKDQVVIDLVGKICNNLAISEEEIYEVFNKCCEYYDNIEFEIG